MILLSSILVLSSISLFLGILLVICDKLLADYGECKITINDERELTVNGGDTILSYLGQNGIYVPSACAGKASCGYCKVRINEGGGMLLPTEKPFLTRKEMKNNTRLACQVKVKNDMDIVLPDFLETVKNIVENGLYNKKQRWRFNLGNGKSAKIKKKKIDKDINPDDLVIISKILEDSKDVDGALISVLQKANTAFNYLPENILSYISEELEIKLSTVYRVATFYNAFSLEPRGKHTITACLGTACQVKGAEKVILNFENELGIKRGNTTSDMFFTLDTVRCLGCCGLAPVVKVKEDIHGAVNRKKVPLIIKSYKYYEE